jgi:ABC-2 type transport system permease protein
MFDLIANNLGGELREGLQSISLLESYNNLVQGIINTSDLILFLSYIFLGVFLTAKSIHSLRSNRQ